MKSSNLHEIRNKITALESQIYMLKKTVPSDHDKTALYLTRMEKTIGELKVELTNLHNVSETAN